ncbi:MAG: 50S ribosomal protein L4 [Eubacteriales bacterium]|nr:50S ribosomal protein L4 [Eubacteriales bacterium]
MAINVKVFDMSGKETGSIELNENIFGAEVNEHVMHQAVVQYLANQRQGTKSAKTRAEVRGGGRKPWRQKGTGRARQGSIRSPQWTGGGVVFAPKPRDFSFKLNKKVKRLALKSALTSKVNEEKFVVLEELKLPEIKTKEMQKVLNNLKINKGLVVLEENNRNVVLSTRNIPNVKTAGVNTINVYDILKYETFVVTKEALSKIEEVYK